MAYPMIHNRIQPICMQFVSPWEANVVHGTQAQYGRYGTITALLDIYNTTHDNETNVMEK